MYASLQHTTNSTFWVRDVCLRHELSETNMKHTFYFFQHGTLGPFCRVTETWTYASKSAGNEVQGHPQWCKSRIFQMHFIFVHFTHGGFPTNFFFQFTVSIQVSGCTEISCVRKVGGPQHTKTYIYIYVLYLRQPVFFFWNEMLSFCGWAGNQQFVKHLGLYRQCRTKLYFCKFSVSIQLGNFQWSTAFIKTKRKPKRNVIGMYPKRSCKYLRTPKLNFHQRPFRKRMQCTFSFLWNKTTLF